MKDQQAPNDLKPIVGVSTSVAMFIGRTKQGSVDKPVRCLNHTTFKTTFSEDVSVADMARYVRLFFQNGGADYYVMRTTNGYEDAFQIIECDVVIFNRLVLPPDPTDEIRTNQLWELASAFCERQRAFS